MQHAAKDFNCKESPIAVFTLFRVHSQYKWWAFRQMGLARQYFKEQPDMCFGEMLGTGKGRGFSMWPDFGRYAFFTSWNSAESAAAFIRESDLYKAVRARSEEVYTLQLLPILSKGCWQGKTPFEPVCSFTEDYEGPVVALTRARIRLNKAFEFWQNVPAVSRETGEAEGLLAQTGVGEMPLIQQGTVSIWSSESSLKAFAYGMHKHKEVVHKTRSRNWYSEELFARFIPLTAEGSWEGRNPLAEYLPLNRHPFKELV
jgi:heme-degrading monooxygenase HmoA